MHEQLFIEYLSLLSSTLRKIHLYSDNGILKFINLNNKNFYHITICIYNY